MGHGTIYVIIFLGILVLLLLWTKRRHSKQFRLVTPLKTMGNGYFVTMSIGTSRITGNRSHDVIPDTGSSVLLVSEPEGRGNTVDTTEKLHRIKYLSGQITYYEFARGQLIHDNGDIEVDLGIVRSHRGSSEHYNVLGLQPDHRGKSFLASLPRGWVVFDFPRGIFGLGNVADIIRDPIATWSFCSHEKGYLMSHLDGITINGVEIPGASDVLWDTGSTLTSVPPLLYDHLMSLPNPLIITLTFNGISIPFQCSHDSINRLLPSKRYPPDLIVIGNRWMCQYGIAFNFRTMMMSAF